MNMQLYYGQDGGMRLHVDGQTYNFTRDEALALRLFLTDYLAHRPQVEVDGGRWILSHTITKDPR